jgi:hypothetical protein
MFAASLNFDNIIVDPRSISYNRTGPNLTSPHDYLTFSISIFTGFIDGSFKAPNTSYCRSSLLKFSSAM